ncbi:hypothetical protein AA313_de0208413 [Arthrobotrys entomopaga]|nr:hypothetical protein AA313_de0208413 [Arthrobotrys entomopaga]
MARLYKLKYEVEHASSFLDDLIQDFKDTKRQLSNLHVFLAEANLSPQGRHDCELVLRELHLGVNKLTNQTDCIEMKLNQKSIFGRAKRRHSLISGELDSIHKNIDRINNRMNVIRQEIQLDMTLQNRREHQNQHESLKRDLEIIHRNTIATDARSIRKEYRKYALAIMTEQFSMDILSNTPQPGDVDKREDEGKIAARVTVIEEVELEEVPVIPIAPVNMLPPIPPSKSSFLDAMKGAFIAVEERIRMPTESLPQTRSGIIPESIELP